MIFGSDCGSFNNYDYLIGLPDERWHIRHSMQSVSLLRHARLPPNLLTAAVGDLDVDGSRAGVGRVHSEAGGLAGEHAARLEARPVGAHLLGVRLGHAVSRGDRHPEGRSGNILVPKLDGNVVVALLDGSVLNYGRGIQVKVFGNLIKKTREGYYILPVITLISSTIKFYKTIYSGN